MTETLSYSGLPLINSENGFSNDTSIQIADRQATRGAGAMAGRVRKSPWRQKPMSDEGERGISSKTSIAFEEHRGFLPDVKMPYPLPAEPVGIADMAGMFGITHRTLHFYEEKNIISSRRAGLMRIYSHRDVHRMAVINLLREIGVPVATIQDVMTQLEATTSQEDADDIFQSALEERRKELNSEISSVRRQIDQINNLTSADGGLSALEDVINEVSLTSEERRCLELMAEGYAPVRLSHALGLTSEEVQSLEAAIIEKFSANNRFQAVAKAVVMGVISD